LCRHYKDGNNQYLNPAKGNFDQYNHYNTSESSAGIIGFFTQGTSSGDGRGSVWFFESPKPEISYSANNKITITPDANVTTFYTTDGSSPIDSSTKIECSGIQEETMTDVTIVKTVASAGGVYSQVSTSVWLPISSDNQYLIQNLERTDFYMTVGDLSGTNTTVNTSSLPQAGMSWHFEDAGTANGIQYYYIYNTSSEAYLQRNNDNLYLTAKQETDAFKFNIVPYFDNGTLAGYNIHSKAVNKYAHKQDGNDSNKTVYLNANDYETRSRWNFVSVANKSFTLPFTLSDNNSATYYTFTSKSADTYLMSPPTASTGYVTTTTGTSDEQKWYFQEAGSDGWATFYYIRNAVSGEAIQFVATPGTGTLSDALQMKSLPDTPTDDYKFALAKTTVDGEYYIIPKPLAQYAKTSYAAVWREGTGTLQTQYDRANSKIKWKVTKAENYVAPPVITYDPSTNTATITCTTPDAAISYATNLSEETSSISVPYTTAVLAEGITTITATATKSETSTSNQTTYNVLIQTTVDDANKRPYLIQSQNNGWTTGEHQGFHYYMVPGETVDGNMYANTTTVFKPSMQWYFKYAERADDGTVYYYIVNNDNGRYMYFYNVAATGYTNGSIYLKESSEFSSSSDNYKFFIRKQSNGYNIVPKLVAPSDSKLTNVHKGSNNNSSDAITLDNGATKANSLWKFILKSDLDQEAPFSASTENATYYYKIHNGVTSNHYITPPATTGGKVVMSDSSDETVQKSMNWYLEKIEDATDTDWLTYYVIRNAVTGDYLYYNYDDNSTPVTPVTTGSDECFEMKSDYDASKKGHYLFTWARSFKDDRYYIVPQILKDYNLNNISSLRRSNKKLNIDVTRNSEAAIWQFKVSDLFCNSPVFEEADGKITLSCNTNASEIRYTTNGEDPTATDVSYSTYSPSLPFSSSDKMVIKACAVVSDGTNTATSDNVTLLNKPDITLAGETYTYKGAAWEPAVTKVSINKTEAPTSPATYSVTYSNNTNARLSTDSNPPTVILDDADPNDSWYIWNGSKTFTIAQKELTVTAGSDTKEYDGTPLTNNNYTNSELAEGDRFESVKITGSQTNVGNSDNEPSAAVIKNASDEDMTSNYNITYVKGTLEVTKKSIGDGNNPASDIDVSIGAGNAIILTYGDITLTEGSKNDYTVGDATSSASGRYSSRTVEANEGGNYTGSFKARNAIVNFQTDDNAVEWSATFVAEPADPDAAPDETKGHVLPAGIMACIIKDIDTGGGRAIAEALDYIPEGIPVLLLSNAESGGFVVKDASGQTAISDDQKSKNMLEEVTDKSQHFDVRTIYLLYQNEFVYNMAGELAKGKVYLKPNHGIGGSRPAPSRLKIRINTEAGTGIDSVTEEEISDAKKDSWYTLDGRRLDGKPQRRGLYITREKKVIVR